MRRSAGRWWPWLLAAIAALPVALVRVPLMADLPNHMARHRVFASPDGPLTHWFAVGWRWIGNLGVDLLAMALAPWLGIENATRLIVALIAPMTVLGIIALGRVAQGRVTAGAMLALPFAFAQPWSYGFVNYLLGVALALLVAAWWLRWSAPGAIARALCFAVAALIVWTAHIQGWAVLLVVVAGAELAHVRGWRDLTVRGVRALPLLMPIAPMLAWRGQAVGLGIAYDQPVLNAKLMTFVTVLKGTHKPFDLAETGLVLAGAVILMVAGLRSHRAARRLVEPRLALAGALLVVATLALPSTLLGSWGADLRLAPVAVMVCLLSLRPTTRLEWPLMALGLALFVARVGWISWCWSEAQPGYAARLALLDSVPRGSRMGFVYSAGDCATPWVLTPDRKLGSYAMTRRDAFTNTMFQIKGADLMTIRAEADRRWFDTSQDVPARCPEGGVDRVALNAKLVAMRSFDTIWLSGGPAGLTPPPGYRVLRRAGGDMLFGR